MLVNTSSSNNFLFNPHFSFIKAYGECSMNGSTLITFTTFNVTNIILLLPLCTFILYLGGKQWLKRRPCSSVVTVSHSDCFTYHMVAVELIGVIGCIICICGICSNFSELIKVGHDVFAFTWYGQLLFHILTCMERYLAVVHPITYLSLKNDRGVRIRNISTGCVWLLCFVGVTLLVKNNFIILDFCLLVLSLMVISFCSLSVLLVLIRPGPGEQAKDMDRVDQSKKRAFFTILIILGVLSMRFVCGVVLATLFLLKGKLNCLVIFCNSLINLPSSLVLPLLFLHRAEKLVCCGKGMQQG